MSDFELLEMKMFEYAFKKGYSDAKIIKFNRIIKKNKSYYIIKCNDIFKNGLYDGIEFTIKLKDMYNLYKLNKNIIIDTDFDFDLIYNFEQGYFQGYIKQLINRKINNNLYIKSFDRGTCIGMDILMHSLYPNYVEDYKNIKIKKLIKNNKILNIF